MNDDDAAAIHELWMKAEDIHYKFKKFVAAIDDEDDRYYAHASLLDRLADIAGRLSDAEDAVEKIKKEKW